MKIDTSFCNQDCGYLQPNEYEQDAMRLKKPHMCKLYNAQVRHGRHHPDIMKCEKCMLYGITNYFKKGENNNDKT